MEHPSHQPYTNGKRADGDRASEGERTHERLELWGGPVPEERSPGKVSPYGNGHTHAPLPSLSPPEIKDFLSPVLDDSQDSGEMRAPPPLEAKDSPSSAENPNAGALAAELRREIAARRDAEERLALSEQRLALSEQRLSYLMRSSPLGFFDCEWDTGRVYYSPRYKEMLGYQENELPDTQATFTQLLHPEDKHNDWLAERQPQGDGTNRFTQVFRLRHKDGNYRWIESSGVEFLDGSGARSRMLGFHRDITARKQLEERLHQSEERFQLLITSSPLGFFDGDLVTGKSYYSPLWKAMLGYRPEDLADTHQTWLDLLHPDDRSSVIATHTQRSFGESRRPFSYALRLRHKDGHYHWVQASGIDFFSSDGRMLRTLGFHADIHALKLAEEALETEKEFLGVTLASISDGVITTDANGKITYLNPSAETMSGLRASEAMGLPIEEFYAKVGAQPRRQADNPVRAVLATGLRAAPHDPAYLQAPGRPERVIADNAAPISERQGQMTGAVLVFHDITDRHRAAEELQKAGRIESLGVLAGGIAHDFNNLLTAVLGNLSVARSGGSLSNRAVDALERAEKACWRARDLTGQLLTFSRGGDPVRKTLTLPPLTEQAIRNVVLNTPIQVEFQVDPNLPTVEADEGQVVQVLHNLGLNAVQAMPGGGSLRIRAQRLPSDAERKHLPMESGDYIEITLRDTGVGILPEHLSKIFDPFFSTKSNGSGLGLAIAYSIIKKHEGAITVDSQPGAGATFRLYLPVSPQSPPPDAAQSPAEQPQEGTRILFMDDDPDIRDLAGAILGLLGYEAILTRDGSEALAQYQAATGAHRPFAAVILDLTIPGGMGGKETMRRLRDLDPGVRGIVSSGYSNDAVIADFRAHGFVAMVAKPYRMEDLARALNEAIHNNALAR